MVEETYDLTKTFTGIDGVNIRITNDQYPNNNQYPIPNIQIIFGY
jgi:hypothetical protein